MDGEFMNYTKYIYVLLILVVTTAAVLTVRTATATQRSGTIAISVSSEKSAYTLGEIVPLAFSLSNQTSETILVAHPSLASGTVRLMISTDGVNFAKYTGPGWGGMHGSSKPIKLDPDGELKTNGTVFYNVRHRFGAQNEMYAERFRRESLGTDIAFSTAGKYWLKAIFDDGKMKLESVPIELEFAEPSGIDAIAWQLVREKSEYAYFVHTGEVKFYPNTPEHSDFLADIQNLRDQLIGSEFAKKVDRMLAERKIIAENLQQIGGDRLKISLLARHYSSQFPVSR